MIYRVYFLLMSKQKISIGLALCRYNKSKEGNNCIEILSIKKRFTYSYFTFIHSYYRGKHAKNNEINYLHYIFDTMSFQEKLTILSLNYGMMWWYVWLNNPEKGINIFDKFGKENGKHRDENLYNDISNCNTKNEDRISERIDYTGFFKRKNIYEKKFLQDGGKRLAELVNDSKNAEAIWEIPKGTHDNNETDLDTAIREFREETHIDSKYYRILYHMNPIITSYKDNGIIYKHIYFIAELNTEGYTAPNIMKPKINFMDSKQISEVADIKWIGLPYIRLLTLPTKSKKYMLNLYSRIIAKFKSAQYGYAHL